MSNNPASARTSVSIPHRRQPLPGDVLASDPLAAWKSPVWSSFPTLKIASFHHHSTEHRPIVEVRILADQEAIHVLFHVQDRYVRCVGQGYNAPVCRDSCVEFFVQTSDSPAAGYFNFEANCGGALLSSWITDARRIPGGFAGYRMLAPEDLSQVAVSHSMPGRVEPEITDLIHWGICLSVPLAIMRKYAQPERMWTEPAPGVTWRGNFYKCGDQTSHPHWASFFPIGDELNFHQPARFGQLSFV